MDITFLGTGSGYPSLNRGASAIIFRREGDYFLIDCGEGTQTQLKKSNIKPGKIQKIFITHLHGDHMFGLPGFLCTLSQGMTKPSKEGKPMEIYGPEGLRKFLRVAMEISRSALNFDYIVHELIPLESYYPEDWETWHPSHEAVGDLHPNEIEGRQIKQSEDGSWELFNDSVMRVVASSLAHRVPCFGYVFHEHVQAGKLDKEKLQARGCSPGPDCAKIKAGQSIQAPDGTIIHPQDILGPPRPGRKVVILGDTKDSSAIAPFAQDADLLVHEATLENGKWEDCVSKGHSTAGMAGEFAKQINAHHLVLTHFSQRYVPKSAPGNKAISELLKNAESLNGEDDNVPCLSKKNIKQKKSRRKGEQERRPSMEDDGSCIIDKLVRQARETFGQEDGKIVQAAEDFTFVTVRVKEPLQVNGVTNVEGE